MYSCEESIPMEGPGTEAGKCCTNDVAALATEPKSKESMADNSTYAANKSVAVGAMDIALLSANVNQLRFLITYNKGSATFYYSFSMVIMSLVLQLAVGITLILKRRWKRCRVNSRSELINSLLVITVYGITVLNIVLAAFSTTVDNISAVKSLDTLPNIV